MVSATSDAFVIAMRGAWTQKIFGALPRPLGPGFVDEVARCYPFNPSLIQLAEQEWAPVAGFQKVRSTILIFAAAAYVQAQRGKAGEWVPALIGPGDLPLSASQVREAIIGSGLIADERTAVNYRQLAATDIVSDDGQRGSARTLDLQRRSAPFSGANPRAAERAATALFLYSIVGARSQGRQGATEAELKAATFAPNAAYAPVDAETVLAEPSCPVPLQRISAQGDIP